MNDDRYVIVIVIYADMGCEWVLKLNFSVPNFGFEMYIEAEMYLIVGVAFVCDGGMVLNSRMYAFGRIDIRIFSNLYQRFY